MTNLTEFSTPNETGGDTFNYADIIFEEIDFKTGFHAFDESLYFSFKDAAQFNSFFQAFTIGQD